MRASVRQNPDGTVTIQATFAPGNSMMECESRILEAVNQAGNLATAHCLQSFDSDGAPISIGGVRMTSKGRITKFYQTPYGSVPVERHVYQSSSGGETFCPLDRDARIVRDATPRFAQMVASKMACMKSTEAVDDLKRSNGRDVARSYLQNVAGDVALIVWEKESIWSYDIPELPAEVATISAGIDGTCVLFCEGGYRQAMVGTIALYDNEGERLHTLYVAAAPEYGKASFYTDMDRELTRILSLYPHAPVVAIADGAEENWRFLGKYSHQPILDFYHAAGYLSDAASALARGSAQRESWTASACHRLKHDPQAAADLLEEMIAVRVEGRDTEIQRKLGAAITYFTNHLGMMDYHAYREQKLPIGSGVTEAACKVVVKERMSGSGMKWKEHGAQTVLTLRALIKSEGRWDQFWTKVSRYGFEILKGSRPN
jgi:hypothetical protein